MFQRFISYLDPSNTSSSDYLATNSNTQLNNPYQTNPNLPVYPDTSDDDSSAADFQPPPPPPPEFSNSGIRKHMSQEIIVGDNVLQDKTSVNNNNPTRVVNRKLSTIASKYIELLQGETEIKRDNVVYEWTGTNWVPGVFILTNFRIIFQASTISTYDDIPLFEGSRIPICSIYKVEKVGGKSNKQDHAYSIEVYSKDLRKAIFSFSPKRKTRSGIVKYLRDERLEIPSNFFCFCHKPNNNIIESGWTIYDPLKEFTRQGLQLQKSKWRVTKVNEKYQISETYPKILVVPSALSDEEVKNCSEFRSKGRIPVLTYYDRQTGCCITRAAQPLMGYFKNSKKQQSDLNMIDAIMQTSTSITSSSPSPNNSVNNNTNQDAFLSVSNTNNTNRLPSPTSSTASNHQPPTSDLIGSPSQQSITPSEVSDDSKVKDKLMIIDLRPMLNAEANRLFKNAGYEKNYKNTELKFMGIDNIHVMRKSFSKLTELSLATGGFTDQFYSKVEQTGWLDHIRFLLLASKFTVECIQRERVSVLLHCSDGWDRTTQVACLAQILMDPYFRTFEGFSVMVEKDWLSFGHQFQKRTGHAAKNFFEGERGPIFLQFLDALYQLLHQNPTAFEYNENFLIFVCDALYSCQYGTFIVDCERERDKLEVQKKTKSIWTQFLEKSTSESVDPSESHNAQYKNPFYDKENTNLTIMPDCRQCSIVFWNNYYLRYTKFMVACDYSKLSEAFLHERGQSLLSDMHNLEDLRSKTEQQNEATILAFQRELKILFTEIERLKGENMQLKSKYDQDTGSLLELCEKQKEELKMWSSKTDAPTVAHSSKEEEEEELVE